MINPFPMLKPVTPLDAFSPHADRAHKAHGLLVVQIDRGLKAIELQLPKADTQAGRRCFLTEALAPVAVIDLVPEIGELVCASNKDVEIYGADERPPCRSKTPYQ